MTVSSDQDRASVADDPRLTSLGEEYASLHDAGSAGGAGTKYLRFFERYANGDWQREVPLALVGAQLAGAMVLDFGCKFGQLTPLFLRLGAAGVINVDVDEEYLRDGARFLGERYGSRYLASDECFIDVASESVDLVYAGEVISHIHPAFLHTFYSEVARVLRPGGRILIYDSNNLAHLPTRLERIENYGQWENGASSELGSNYERQRAVLLRKSFPELDQERAAWFAKRCAGLHTRRLLATVRQALDTGQFVPRVFRPGQVPVHPGYGVMMERMFHPLQVEMDLAEHGIAAVQLANDDPARVVSSEQERGASGVFIIRGEKVPDSLEARLHLARERNARGQ